MYGKVFNFLDWNYFYPSLPNTMTPVRRSMVKVWDTAELLLSELLHKSSNSNSPKTITKLNLN